jgi:hypothetical protein
MQVQQRQHPVIFEVLRAQAGRMAETNRSRSPASESTRLSFNLRCGDVHRARDGEDPAGLVVAIAQ